MIAQAVQAVAFWLDKPWNGLLLFLLVSTTLLAGATSFISKQIVKKRWDWQRWIGWANKLNSRQAVEASVTAMISDVKKGNITPAQ